MVQSVPFQFSWKALHLLGKSLYSNAWSAISELVANGFDAKARNVLVLIDAKDKKNSVIEILDDGAGMSDDDILTYVKVGYDKREDAFEKKKRRCFTIERNNGQKGHWETGRPISFNR